MSRFEDSNRALHSLADKAENLSRAGGPYTRLLASVQRIRPSAPTIRQQVAQALLKVSYRIEAQAAPPKSSPGRSAKHTLPRSRARARTSHKAVEADFRTKVYQASIRALGKVSRAVARWLQS